MKLTARDYKRLNGVHDDLVKVVEHGFYLFDDSVSKISGSHLIITEGVRTKEKQAEYVAAGKSHTENSRHLTGHAFDFAVVSGTVAHWELPLYERVWLACFRPAGMLNNIGLTWGGYWPNLRDGPHIELNREDYP
jgi:peptidoglycan LD-endopeptidase CwlK